MTHFLFTVEVLFSLLFFRNADVFIFAKTTALFNFTFIQDKPIVLNVSMKICDQSDIAILNKPSLISSVL